MTAPHDATLTAHDLSAALFARGLGNLKVLLSKGQAHASATAMDPALLLRSRLATDMYDLATQVHWASEAAMMATARLLGVAPTLSPNDVASFEALQQRLDQSIAALNGLSPVDLEAGLARTIEIPHRGVTKTFTGRTFLLEFALPTFFFHATSAYGILRNQGVEVTKADFMGPWV